MQKKIIDVSHLKKSYGKYTALSDINFHVKKGKIYALLGPNGAGKSTIINILCGCEHYDEGRIIIDHIPLRTPASVLKIKKFIGVVFQHGVLDDTLTVWENLQIRGQFYDMYGKSLQTQIDHIAHLTDITSILGKPYGVLSGGQKRRCDIARALLPQPHILFLDEPTSGLDPEIRTAIWKTLTSIRQKTNLTILLTTHYMEEAVQADYISILNQGHIVTSDSPTQLQKHFSRSQLLLTDCKIENIRYLLKQHNISYSLHGNSVIIPLVSTMDALPVLNLCRGYYSGFEVRTGTMEDAYLSIIEGRPAFV